MARRRFKRSAAPSIQVGLHSNMPLGFSAKSAHELTETVQSAGLKRVDGRRADNDALGVLTDVLGGGIIGNTEAGCQRQRRNGTQCVQSVG